MQRNHQRPLLLDGNEMMKKQRSNLKRDIRLKSMTPEELASHLNVSERTLAKWRSIGHPNIPYMKVGRCVRYNISDLEDYLAKHTINNVEV